MYKVCHVTSVHQPEDGRIFRRACVSLAKAGYDTYLVERGDSYDKDGVHIIGIGKPEKPGRLYRMTTFSKKAYDVALKVDADLYHLHDPELLLFARKLKSKGKKVVFDSHENYVVMIRNKNFLFFPRLIAKCYEIYSNYIFSKIDGVVYTNNSEFYRNVSKICKHTCFTRNYPWKNELYDYYSDKIQKEKNTACFIGSLTKAHGIVEIVKACYQAGYKLYLAGTFYSEEFKNEVFSLKEFSCVDFLGVIGRDKVLDILQKVEVGLCVLHNVGQFYPGHNLSTKVYECMAMAIPVILNDSPYNVYVINKYAFGKCVNPLEVSEIAKTLQEYAVNDRLRVDTGKRGQQLFLEKCCWDQEQNNLLKMYEEIFKDGN